MASLLSGDSSHHGISESGLSKLSQDKQEEVGGRWYYSRKEIEENSPSRKDGIDLKKEAYLRKSYCTFLQDLGMRLKVPQVTIATAIVFCHRFFLRQSHAKNDRRTIATVCMFLAGKVEETPRPLKDVILVSYEIIHKKDPAAVQKIKQKEVYEQQKELILLGERVVLATLGFDLNVHHPYKPLVEAIKKFKVAQNALAQVAWNFVNDGLRTSLCLQFKPHHIAAGAIFLAAKFLKVKLPSDGEKVWWQEFDVTPRQLEEVSNQMLELYEQNRLPPSQASEVEGSGGVTQWVPPKAPAANEEHAPNNSSSLGGGVTSRVMISKMAPGPGQSHVDNDGTPRTTHNQNNDYGSTDVTSTMDHKEDGGINNNQHREPMEPLPHKENMVEGYASRFSSGGHGEEDHDRSGGKTDIKLDKDKLKAAIEKRRKSRGDIARRTDLLDEDDLIERELEDGIEIAAESEKTKSERRQKWFKSSNQLDHENLHHVQHQDGSADEHHQGSKMHSSRGQDFDAVEEGEVETFEDSDRGYRSPKSTNRKRKAGGSPLDKTMEGKQQHDYIQGSHKYNHHDFSEDRSKLGRINYSERDHKRQVQENHV